MKNKLKLVLWGKNLELPEDYDNLEFDNYEFSYSKCIPKQQRLYLYKNNEMIKQIWYYDNGNKDIEYNYKNGKWNGKQCSWYSDRRLSYKWNYKNGKEDGKQYGWWGDGKLDYERNYKNGEQDGKQYWWSNNGKLKYEHNYKNGK